MVKIVTNVWQAFKYNLKFESEVKVQHYHTNAKILQQ